MQEDRALKDRTVTDNKADMQIYQTEIQLKELGNTLPLEKKNAIENALEKLKLAHENPDFDNIEEAMNNLSSACLSAGEY